LPKPIELPTKSMMVRLIQSKALRERLEQTRVGVLGVPKHRRVGFERDVDRCHRILLRDGSLGKPDRQRQPEPDDGEDPCVWMAGLTQDAGMLGTTSVFIACSVNV
jgi:hypothetical protein